MISSLLLQEGQDKDYGNDMKKLPYFIQRNFFQGIRSASWDVHNTGLEKKNDARSDKQRIG
jgi:hypothetical protein